MKEEFEINLHFLKKLGHQARPEAQQARPQAQPGRPQAQLAKLQASGLAGWASGLAGWASNLAGWASGLAGWASGLAGWPRGGMYVRTNKQIISPFYRTWSPIGATALLPKGSSRLIKRSRARELLTI